MNTARELLILYKKSHLIPLLDTPHDSAAELTEQPHDSHNEDAMSMLRRATQEDYIAHLSGQSNDHAHLSGQSDDHAT